MPRCRSVEQTPFYARREKSQKPRVLTRISLCCVRFRNFNLGGGALCSAQGFVARWIFIVVPASHLAKTARRRLSAGNCRGA